MTTAQTMIDLTRNRYLLGGATEQRNKLAADYTAGQTTLAFAYSLAGIRPGALLSVGTNTFYVWDVNDTATSATVEGGYNGSTDAHANAGDIVRVAPRYTDFDIFAALNEEILSLSSAGVGLFQMKTVEFPYNASRIGFDLVGVSSILDVHEVRYAAADARSSTPRLPAYAYRLERGYTTGENSSTFSLKMWQSGVPGQNITVTYRAPFSPFSAITDDVSVTGMDVGMLDIPPMGAALRLGLGQEIRRNDTRSQGDTRRAEEVTAGSVGASYRGLDGRRQTRIGEELGRLRSLYPYRT